MDRVELSFTSKAQKLNKKRQAQLVKRVEKILPELQKAHEKGDKKEVEGILKSIEMPSKKEWRKLVRGLVTDAVESGVIRGHYEILRLKELYEFSDAGNGAHYTYEVVLPKEAKDYLNNYGLELSVITEETVLTRIRDELDKCLEEGASPREVAERVKDKAGTWMSDSHAQTIARTETGKMYNAGKLARYSDPDNNGFVEAMQYDAIVDTRTTDLCQHLDGRIIAITNGSMIAQYTPPNHYQCRATWLPVTKYEEWEDNWDNSIQPQDGFVFTPDVPKLLQGKQSNQPLVKPKQKPDLSKLTDPDIIRTLDDDDFKRALKNITDQELKVSLAKERAELMLVKNNGLKVTERKDFQYGGIHGRNSAQGTAKIEIYGKEYSFAYNSSIRDTVEEFGSKLYDAKTLKEAETLFNAFRKANGSNLNMADFIIKVETALKTGGKAMTWNGLEKVVQTSASAKLLKIKTPPKTANYKNATGLQQAVTDGQKWLTDHVPPELAPATGVKLRFSKNNSRAYATGGTGEIYFGPWEKNAGVIVHEVGHVLHWQSKEVSDMVNSFFMTRTNNLTMAKTLRHGEEVIPDDFFNSYIGRIYGWETRNMGRATGNQFYGQEVLSMGMQAMYENPIAFYQNDKDHFLFTYAIMKGLY
ncbi:head morphogenesis protein [Bacillus phage vB_BpsS-36]|uniref:Head morphogenesis protein n=1 Tax=Bacillus phage vB_BpsS-36 TaxID=2419622 RepID=A0A3G3BXP5_9CAUD|nr:head morphogenesis protein [Bacillus phage vB_BpsS-36]